MKIKELEVAFFSLQKKKKKIEVLSKRRKIEDHSPRYPVSKLNGGVYFRILF